ncbi:MAG TPA: GGDEF domain-containing protein [Sulfurovum sp.]|nr:GGDEF domain-containing protein [Sulfurovum sp.]
MYKLLYFFFIYLYFSTTLFANSSNPSIDISSSHHTIGKYTSIYEDITSSLKISDILKLPETSFALLHTSVSSQGFSESSFWYTFKVNNPQKTPLSRLLIFAPAWLDHIEVYILSKEGEIQRYKGGNRSHYSNRALPHYLTNFKHSFRTGESKVYIKVQTRDPLILSISLMDEHTFLSENTFLSLFIGFFYGGMIALLVYNLFLYFGIKKNYYLFYVFYLFTFLLVNAAYNGYTFMYMFYDLPEVQNWAQAILSYIFICAALLFAMSFLDLKEHHPKLYQSSVYLRYFIIILALSSSILGGYHLSIMFGIISVMIGSIYITLVALYSWMKGSRYARFFLLGSISGLIGISITAMTLLSFIPYSYFTFKASDFGMFIDLMMLSFALADRMKITQEEKIKAEQDAQTDILTGLLNRRAYYAISNIESKKLSRQYRDFSVMMLDIDNFKQVNDTYGHHVGDLLLQKVSKAMKDSIREFDYIFRIGGDEFILFLTETNEKEAYQLANRLCETIAQIDIPLTSGDLVFSCSIGIGTFRRSDKHIEMTVKRADDALYAVKEDGKNSVKISNN